MNVDELHQGRKAVVRGVQGPFTAGGATCELPAVQCGGQNVFLRRGSAPQTLSPGTYNQVSLENGTSLTLQPGVYTFCELSAGRHVTIRVVGSSQSTINVGGEVRLGNDTTLGPDGSTPTPLLNVAGDVVHFGAQDEVRAFITAPSAKLSIGRGTTFTGAACARTLNLSRKVTVKCAPDVPVTTTTTSTTLQSTTTTTGASTTSTSTTTTTTTTLLCGNGVLDPGEECDGSAFGGFTCPSPSGALLCTGDCKIDFSECPEASSTTTSSTSPTTTTTTPSTTTSTTSIPPTTTSTTTTTTTTTTLRCGNGILDPGEECDGSAFGGFTCPSPGGALLCTGDCKIDFSECPSASSTTTTAAPTTTVPTTTSTTVTTSTTAPIPTTTTSSTTTSTIPETTTTLPETTTSSSSTTTSTTTSTTQPAPTVLDFVLSAATGTCGDTRDGSNTVIKNLNCGGLSIGAGASIIPEGPTPDGSISRFALSCAGSSCTIGPTSTVPPVDTAGPDCTDTGCNFGTPLPIPNPLIPSITTCVLNTWNAAASGTLDLSTGASSTNVPLISDTYLTGNLAQPCPRCSATGTPASPGTGTCDRGPRATLACMTTSSTGYTRDCPTGGTDGTHPCTPGGGACIDGSHVGPINVNLSPLTTGTATMTNATGAFCPGQTNASGHLFGCFGSAACRTITENGSPAGAISTGVPAPATLASTFCIAGTGNGLVDASADLPGPGAVSLPGTFVAN